MVPGDKLRVVGEPAAWLVHAVALTREQQALGSTEIEDAPELFWAELGSVSSAYPFLEVHREGSNRDVYAIR